MPGRPFLDGGGSKVDPAAAAIWLLYQAISSCPLTFVPFVPFLPCQSMELLYRSLQLDPFHASSVFPPMCQFPHSHRWLQPVLKKNSALAGRSCLETFSALEIYDKETNQKNGMHRKRLRMRVSSHKQEVGLVLSKVLTQKALLKRYSFLVQPCICEELPM